MAGIPERAKSIAVALIVSIGLCGCAATQKPFEAPPGSEAAMGLSLLEAQGKGRESFKGIGRFRTYRGEGKGKASRIAWIGMTPHSVRVEALVPWGPPTLTLIVHESTYHVYSRQDNRYFRGDASPRNLSRIVSLPVSAEDLFRLLSGRAPVHPFDDIKVRAASDGNGPVLSLYRNWRRLMQRIWLKEDTGVVEQVEVYDGWGRLEYRVSFDDFRKLDSGYYPHALIVSDKQGPVWSLDTEKFWTQVPVPDGAFTLQVDGLPEANLN